MRSVKWISILILTGLSLFSIIYMVTKTMEESGAIDFHSYWYSGHFVRQRNDPYQAYLDRQEPGVPVTYLDGVVTDSLPIARSGLADTPANTTPVVILLTLFSLFSWPLAKISWMICNIIFMAITPLLVIRLLPKNDTFGIYSKLLICLLFFPLFGTRNIVGTGQTSLFVFALMLITILSADRSWLIAGIALGLSLSKYSLALPVFLFMIWRKEYRVITTSLMVQLIGWLFLTAFTSAPLLEIPLAYIQLLLIHVDLPGIHLGSLFPQNPIQTIIASLGLTLVVFISLFQIYRSRISGDSKLTNQTPGNQIMHLHIIIILTIWTLLIAYHRAYDTFVVILFIALTLYGLKTRDVWKITRRERVFLVITTILTVFVMLLPARGIYAIGQLLPDNILNSWLDIQGRGMTLMLIFLLGVSIWLLYKVGMTPNQLDPSETH